MTFEDAYKALFESIVKYCYVRNGKDRYYAEESTAKAFEVLYRKWDTLPSHEEKFIKGWLVRAADNTIREVRRSAPSAYMPIEEAWCQDLIDEQHCRNHYDEDQEAYCFAEYIKEIEAKLEPKDRQLFHYVMVEQLPFNKIANNMNTSENAVRIKWTRLKRKLSPIIFSVLNKK